MPTRRPLELYFNVSDEDHNQRAQFEISLGEHGQILDIFINGVRVNRLTNPYDLFEMLLTQGYLLAQSEKDAFKRSEDCG